jgi:hypothetical protein
VATHAGALVPLASLCGEIATGAACYAVLLRVVDRDAYRLARNRVGRFLGLRQAR